MKKSYIKLLAGLFMFTSLGAVANVTAAQSAAQIQAQTQPEVTSTKGTERVYVRCWNVAGKIIDSQFDSSRLITESDTKIVFKNDSGNLTTVYNTSCIVTRFPG